MKRDISAFSFSEAELVSAAGAVRESMLKALPHPKECNAEFSDEFHRKMNRLFAREKAMHAFETARRWAAAILLLAFIGAAAILTVDTEARAAFFEWVRKIHENSVIYEFFNEPTDQVLPTYELGWVPEGYELVEEYRDGTSRSVIYQRGDQVFVFGYHHGDIETLVEVFVNFEDYEHGVIKNNDIEVEFYRALDELDNSIVIWFDEDNGILFFIDGFLFEDDMLHIIDDIFLVK